MLPPPVPSTNNHTHCDSLPRTLLLVIRHRLHPSCHRIHTGFVYLTALLMMTTFQSFPLYSNPPPASIASGSQSQSQSTVASKRKYSLKTRLSQALGNDRGQGRSCLSPFAQPRCRHVQSSVQRFHDHSDPSTSRVSRASRASRASRHVT